MAQSVKQKLEQERVQMARGRQGSKSASRKASLSALTGRKSKKSVSAMYGGMPVPGGAPSHALHHVLRISLCSW